MPADYLLAFCRIATGLLFAVSAIGKLRDFAAFRASVAGFELLPRAWSPIAARVLLGAEVGVVLLLAVGGPLLPVGFWLAALVLLGFSAALVAVLRRGLRVTCNCFGPTTRHVSYYDVIRNLVLLAVALLGVLALAASGQALDGTEIVLVALMAGCFVALLTQLADVAETLRRPFSVMED
jgi:Methylamine utilisation protein MauE